ALFVDAGTASYAPDTLVGSGAVRIMLERFAATLCVLLVMLQNGVCNPPRSASATPINSARKNASRGETLLPGPATETEADSLKQRGDLGAVRWRNIGPPSFGGHVTDVAVPDVAGGSVIYAASPGGLFKSVDAGDTWMPVFDGEATSAVNAVAV